jgi:hypothetical protein
MVNRIDPVELAGALNAWLTANSELLPKSLALLRGAVLRLHDTEAFESLNAGFHHHTAKPYAALRHCVTEHK